MTGIDPSNLVNAAAGQHPAAALYNGGMRQTLIDDFIQAVEFVKKNSGA